MQEWSHSQPLLKDNRTMSAPHPGRISFISQSIARSLMVVAALAVFAATGTNVALGDEPAAKATPSPASVLIKDVPFLVQEPDFCGEACAAMTLQKLGRKVDQDYVFNQSGLDPLEGRGCYTRELAAALTKIGFRIGAVWYKIPAREAAQAVETQWRAIYADLRAGIPAIVCMHYSDRPQCDGAFPPRPRLRRRDGRGDLSRAGAGRRGLSPHGAGDVPEALAAVRGQWGVGGDPAADGARPLAAGAARTHDLHGRRLRPAHDEAEEENPRAGVHRAHRAAVRGPGRRAAGSRPRPGRAHRPLGGHQAQGRLFHQGAEGDSRHLAVQGQRQLPQMLQGAFSTTRPTRPTGSIRTWTGP